MQAVRSGNVCEILVNDETKKKREFGSCLLDWFIIGPCFFGWTKEALAAGSDYWVNSDFNCHFFSFFYFFVQKNLLICGFFGRGGRGGVLGKDITGNGFNVEWR